MKKVTLPQAQAIAERQYEIKRKRPGMEQRSDWIITRARSIMKNGADTQEMKLLQEAQGRAA